MEYYVIYSKMEGLKMIKLYTIAKEKTNILGLWQDKRGKIYFDNILIKNYNNTPKGMTLFYKNKEKLFNKGEKAVFAVQKNIAIIFYYEGCQEILKHKIELKKDKLYHNELKNLLKVYGGLTIFKRENDFLIEIWTN